MSIKETGHHFVAIFGGAVAGSEAAGQLAGRGFRVVVFDQAILPYGKIEDGLPKWHYKLRDKEERRIDEKINHPNIMYVPKVKLGKDLDFKDVLNWGFNTIILATGAWRDRPLPIEGIDAFVDQGLVYQNPFVYWFNHKHEPDYRGPLYEVKDGAAVIGGGLASLDVVKILMIETVKRALRERGLEKDMFTLEHGIGKVLQDLELNLNDLGLKGCTLFYRRRAIDMPLSPMATNTPELLAKAQMVRKKILDNFQRKYLFNFVPCCAPIDKIVEDGQLIGIVFQRTAIENDKVKPIAGDILKVKTRQVISSIGSVPEKIDGIPADGSVFRIANPNSCRIDGFENVFAIGNAVTGKGNINESIKHSREISSEIMEKFLEWQQDDYENWHRQTAVKVDKDIHSIIASIEKQKFLPDDVVDSILHKVISLQQKAGYDGDYANWVKINLPERLEDMITK